MAVKRLKNFDMETKKCPKCGRELPATEFNKNRSHPDGLQAYCRSCMYSYTKAAKKRRSDVANSVVGGGKLPPFSDPDFDGKTNREVMDIMRRCKRWLEARGCTIHLSGEYTEVKKLKF